MEIKNEFIPYEQALALKELGFDEPCFGCYDEKGVFGFTVMSIKQYYINSKEDTWNCSAPTYSQAFRWFREKYNLFGQVNIHTYFIYNISNDGFEMIKQYDKLTNTYEEAELACLNKLIEIVKK
jgi:hypothetical protein